MQVKALAKGVGPGAVRDFATAVAMLREEAGECVALLVATVGAPTSGALNCAKGNGIVCLHVTELDGWLSRYARTQGGGQ